MANDNDARHAAAPGPFVRVLAVMSNVPMAMSFAGSVSVGMGALGR